jgi:hypothetical protein
MESKMHNAKGNLKEDQEEIGRTHQKNALEVKFLGIYEIRTSA